MKGNRTLGWIPILSVFVALRAFAQPVHVQEPPPQSMPAAPKLVFLKSDATGAGGRLVECERLTIEEYKESGTHVVVVTQVEFKRWLETEGKEYARARERFAAIAYARAARADAIGGLGISTQEADDGAKKLVYYGWGAAITAGVAHNGYPTIDKGDRARAIPLFGLERDENWSVPMRVKPEPCSSTFLTPVQKGERAYLGLSLDGNQVTAVSPESPAAEAGLSAGVKVIAVDDKSVTDQDSLRKLLEPRKPGEEIRVEYERDSTTIKKTVRLADYYEYLRKTAPAGKPLPPLVATDIDGREVKLADLKGKVLLLDFWATWCGPCIADMPGVQLLWEQARHRGFVLVSVSVDEDEAAWKDFVHHNRLGGIQVRSPEWAEALRIRGYPTKLLVDRAGILRCVTLDTAENTWALLDER